MSFDVLSGELKIMRFIYGRSPAFTPDELVIEDYSAIGIDSLDIIANRRGMAVGIIVMIFTLVLWVVAGTDPLGQYLSFLEHPRLLPLLMAPMWFVALVVAHEVVHFISFPGFWKKGRAGFGLAPGVFVPYTWTTGAVRKWRFASAILAPFVAITFLPLVIQFAFHVFPVESCVSMMSIVNAGLAGADLVVAALVFVRVPHGAYIQANVFGMKLKPSALPSVRRGAKRQV